MNMIHLDDPDRNKSPQNYGKRVYNQAIRLIEQARGLSDSPTLVLSKYAMDLIKLYLADSGIETELKSLGGVPVEVCDNHIEQNHALASIGVRA